MNPATTITEPSAATMSSVDVNGLDWQAPNPGPWMQDMVHWPHGLSPLVADRCTAAIERGFRESYARWGLLLDSVAFAVVNGFVFTQPQPFDAPGPDGPPSDEWLGAEIGRRVAIAGKMFETKAWREVMARWDDEIKPAAVARHRQLGDTELDELDDDALRSHLTTCLQHLEAMSEQHHRFNATACMLPADFVLTVGDWLDQHPDALLCVFDGYSPSSSVVSPELEPALAALRDAPAETTALLTAGTPAAARLDQLRRLVPAVDEYVRTVGFRLIEGIDVTNPTAIECPELILGRFASGLTADPDEARRRSDAFAAQLRDRLPHERQGQFDELLAEARLVYRLRDERALYSDVSASGILRWGVLEAGRRLVARGAISEPTDLFVLEADALDELLAGTSTLTAQDVTRRVARAEAIRSIGTPAGLGPDMPEPPPVDQLPGPVARTMRAIGYVIKGLWGELEAPAGDDRRVGGLAAGLGVHEGRVLVAHSTDDLFDLEPGDVLVTRTTGEAINSMLHLIGAIVTDHGGVASHAAIVARECGFPAVVGTTDATRRLRTGQTVRVDGTSGEVTVL